MLGTSYQVRAFGVSSSTVLFNGFPYVDQEEFIAAKKFLPKIIIIMLGTNDAREDTYQLIDNFVTEYKYLIHEVQKLESKPKIFLVTPPPLFDNILHLSNANLLEGVIPRIKQVARDLDLNLIDIYTPLADHPEYFPDGVHPNSEAASLIAGEIYKAI